MPVLRRLAAGLPGLDDLVFFDTLPLARSLLEESAKLGTWPTASGSTPAGRTTPRRRERRSSASCATSAP